MGYSHVKDPDTIPEGSQRWQTTEENAIKKNNKMTRNDSRAIKDFKAPQQESPDPTLNKLIIIIITLIIKLSWGFSREASKQRVFT